MKTHLLSIFPVDGQEIHSRGVFTALEEASRLYEPFISESPACLRERLATCLPDDVVSKILTLIHTGETIHYQITDEEARLLGFLDFIPKPLCTKCQAAKSSA